MRVALTHHWMDDLHPEHRQRIVDMCLTIEEAATSQWLLPRPDGRDARHGPTLTFDSSRSWEEVVQDLESEGFYLDEYHAVSVG